jgi:hypothetical protein
MKGKGGVGGGQGIHVINLTVGGVPTVVFLPVPGGDPDFFISEGLSIPQRLVGNFLPGRTGGKKQQEAKSQVFPGEIGPRTGR